MYHQTGIEALVLLVSSFLAWGTPEQPTAEFKKIPVDIIKHMLTIAEVNGEDTLYDIGSGDASIAFNAARRYGAYSIGVTPETQLSVNSDRKAANPLVGELVQFKHSELLHTDMHDATVVTLYTSSSQNMVLRPKLLQQLKPGTRIVSHNSDMGDWEPDKIVRLGDESVFYWQVPGNVSGIWEWETQGKDFSVEIVQRFQRAGATPLSENLSADCHFTVAGKLIRFELSAPQSVSYRYTGSIDGDEISGFVLTPAGDWVPWHAERKRNTLTPIDDSPTKHGSRS